MVARRRINTEEAAMRLIQTLVPVLVLGLCAAPALAQTATCGTFEAVEPGDTVEAVADRCGIALSDLLELNPALRRQAPAEGSVIRLDGGPRTSLNEDGANEGSSAEYAYNITGDWRGTDGRCDREVGSWSFGFDVVRGNATRFDVREVFGHGGAIVVETMRRDGGEPVRLTLERAGDRMAVTAPGIAADLARCPGNRAGYLPQEGGGDGPRDAYEAALTGRWRGEGETCERLVGTWTFGAGSIVANGNDYAIRSISGDAAGIVANLTAPSGREVAFLLEPEAPDRVRATGPGFVTTLIRCR